MGLILFWAFLVATAMPQATPPPLRSESTVVLTPTLVIAKSGEIVHDLRPDDFVVEDNGVAQAIRIDESAESQLISLVVAVQRGGSAYLNFQPPDNPVPHTGFEGPKQRPAKAALGDLGTMVEGLVGGSKNEVAIVVFDTRVELLRNFTTDVPAVAEELRTLRPSGASGASILDAVYFSLGMLEQRANDHTKILLLLSEQRDHGSGIKLDDVVRQIALGNTQIYSLSFSPLRTEAVRDMGEQNPDPGTGVNVLKIIGLTSNAFRKKSAQAVAQWAGGEHWKFSDASSLDRSMGQLNVHLRSRYLISFQPKAPQPGLHTIKVRLRSPRNDVVVVARDHYWAVAPGQ